MLRLYNTIVFNNTPEGIFTSGIGIDSQRSFLGIDPGFLTLEGGDYRLRPDGLGVDAGEQSLVPLDLLLDLDGNPRVQGSGVDVGAYERE